MTVTLLSGDKVAVVGGEAGAVVPAPGRAGVRFVRRTSGADTYVIPSDAAGAVAAGTLDRQLFNVTRLAESGEHGEVPIIVRYADSAGGERARQELKAAGAAEQRPIRALSARAVTVENAATAAVWDKLVRADGIRRVWLDAEVQPLLDKSVPQIGAPAAWQAGLTGKGVKVAILDSGLDPDHPDLRGRVVAAKSFIDDDPGTADLDGHGTHVASTVAGSGAASEGRYRGVAADADLLIGRVCQDGCSTSSVLDGMQWAVDNGARIVNLSLGGPDEPGIDPLEEAVNTLTARSGTLFVVAAGNDGGDRTVSSPASAQSALAVAAVDGDDALAGFSSRGPGADGAVKPDLAAPGAGIVAARARDTLALEAVDDNYAKLSGTSMATPHVTGSAALLAQAHPGWRAEQLKGALVGGATPIRADAYAVGSGRVDVASAMSATAYASPTSLSFGLARWPHPAGQRQTRTVTLHNTAGTARTFDLTVSSPDVGVFTLSSARVAVAAHGSAEVGVTAHTGLDGRDGRFPGVLTATSGGTRVRIAMGVEREVPSHDVTVTAKDRTGSPVDAYVILYPMPATGDGMEIALTDGTGEARVPAGRWTAVAATVEPVGGQSIEVFPDLELSNDTTLAFDSRKAKKIDVTVPEKSARLGRSYAGIVLGSDDYGVTFAIDGPSGPTMKRTAGLYAVPTRTRKTRDLVFFSESQWVRPNGTEATDSPYTYHVVLPTAGGIPSTLRHAVRRSELATVTSTYQGSGTVQSIAMPYFGHRVGGGFWTPVVNTVPGSRTSYFTTGGGTVAWRQSMIFGDTEQSAPARVLRAGRTYPMRWNGPVFGPSLPGLSSGQRPLVARQGDVIAARVPLFSDGGAPEHYGYALQATGTAQLFRNGELIAEDPDPQRLVAEVPADDAAYRLAITASAAERTVTAEWTFRSARAAGTTVLPLSTVRFAPRPGSIGVTVQSQDSGEGGSTRKLAVQTSTDDGRTWQPATVRRLPGGRWTAVVTTPPAAGTWVALRSTLTRADGGTATQTLSRAYRG
ncbi:peptidase S8 [Actinoplanes sp. ATCC 53533]|uniref:S8 family peptidase n=1 Tax=Actinoplanes sp. ATCC 53533 TaxID=1288362 RepID=UPI000F78A38B|nr:S8 family serine peptidase [Actinoplanes sp. ATCC 53533]RSM70707.1 peptidase S8 [Actinoplanes sp. ATCC 53533]